MGNSPSKNASPNTHNSNNALNTGSSSGVSAIAVPGEPEPDDRKFPSYQSNTNTYHRNTSNKYNKTTNINNNSNTPISNNAKLHYNRDKLQKNKLSKSPKKFTYMPPQDDPRDDGALNEFDMDISVSMAKALKHSPPAKNHGGDEYVTDEDLSANGRNGVNPISATSTSTTTVDEVSSSFSDLFTIDSSVSSSLSTTPPFFNNNLPPITEEIPKKTSLHTRKPRLGPNDIDIDSIIEKLLTTAGNSSANSGNGSSSSTNSSPTLGFKSKDEFFIKPHEIAIICSKAREIFLSQPSLLRLSAPVKVVGDIHGQFNDLLRILKLSGLPPHSNYLFLGDYVDRGKQSLETILLLFCFKIKYPENFFMLRGNHESANITKIYGFYDECKRRSSLKSWKSFIDVFNTLPIAAVINDKIFCIHGGLSPHLNNLKQIEELKRPTDIPETGLFADFLWSDPDPNVAEWSDNDRGVSYCFGKKIVDNFCKKFKFDLIIRGHMVVEDGYEFFARKKLVTIFSAPNYCGEFNNWGAVMSVDNGLLCSFELLKPNKKAITP